MRRKRWVLAGAAILAIGTATVVFSTSEGPAAGFLTPDDPAVVALGSEVYAARCASCHGANLEGEENWREPGPDGLLPAPPHDETGHTWHHPDAQLFAITKYGSEAVVGGGYRSAMIGFGDVLSDAQIVAVLSYIKSTWPQRVREVHDERNRAFDAAQP